MAQPDSCPDVSNGAIIHSPVIICSELDNHREREDDEGEEEDDEVELAEEVGEDVLMMVGAEEGQVEGENREMKVAEEVQTIQVFPLPNGVLSEESVGGGIQEENNERGLATGCQGCEIPEEQKSGTVLNESITEETSHETGSVLENHCHLSPELQVEKHEEAHFENNEDNKVTKDEGHIDEETNFETNEGIEENEKHEETNESNVGMEEKEAGETHLENSEEINEIEEECKNQDIIISAETELKAESSEGTDNGFEEHELSCTDEDQCQVSDSHEQESKETGQLSFDDTEKTENIIIDDEMTNRSEDLLVNTVPNTIEEDRSINQDNDREDSAVSDCCILTDVTGTIKVLANQTNQQANDRDSEIKGTHDNNQSSQKEAESVIEDSSPQNDYVEAEGEDEGGEDFPQDVSSEPWVVQEMESEVDQIVDQPEVAVATDQEQSATTKCVQEEQIEEIGDILGEEEEQVCDHVPNAMDLRKEGKEEDGDTGENNAGEPVCEGEHKGTDDKDVHENVSPAENDKAEKDIPEPELQCMDDVSLESKQDMELIQAEEALEMEDENPPEPEDIKAEENDSTTQEAGDFQEHPTQTLDADVQTSKDAEDNSRGIQREQGLAEECVGGGPATDPLVEEPVTILDDEFDEIEDAPATELDDSTPETTASPCDDPAEAKAETDGQKKEMQQDKEKEAGEGVKANEDDIEVFLELNERVRGLKEALENGTLGVEPPPSNKEECRPARVSSSKRKDDDWIKKNEPKAETTTEAKEWKKEPPKPVRKDFWESETARKEAPPPDEKGPQRRDDWITELKSVIKDESLPRRRDEQVKKKRVVLFEDGRSYFPHREETTEKREEVTLISHKKVDGPPVSPVPPVPSDDKAPHDQVYEISLYVKVKRNSSQSIYSLIVGKLFKMH